MSSILDNPGIRRAALPISVDQYHQLGAAGIISKNTELLSGVIVGKMIKSPQHSWLVQTLAQLIREAIGNDCHLRQEQPLTLADSEPEPDIAVVDGVADDYRSSHPATARLVMEVAITSADVDRQKAELYATAGVSECWLILPEESAVEVFTQPETGKYSQTKRFSQTEQVAVATVPGLTIVLGRLLR